jgi:hypothetical protein
MKRTFYILLFFMAIKMVICQTVSPEVISSGCISYSNSSYSWESTIGECFTETLEDNQIIFTQGFQQMYETTAAVNENEIEKYINLFPNPANEFITINIDDQQMPENIFFRLINTQGQLIMQSEIVARVYLGDLDRGIYIITFFNDRKILTSKRIAIL